MSDVNGIAAEQLRSYIERVERLEDEKKYFSAEIREVYAEAKGNGFDPAIMRQIVKLRSMDPSDRQEMEALLDVYRAALAV